MSIYHATALLIVGMIVIPSVVGFIRHEMRSGRACREGWLVTYGITGNPADLERQKRDLERLHAGAAKVGNRTPVEPFPLRARRVVLQLIRGGESA